MKTRVITLLGVLAFSLSCPLSQSQTESDVGITCFQKNDFKGALSHFSKTLKSKPTDYNALYYSAIIYHRTGSVQQAKATYEKLIKLYPNSDAGRNAMAALRYLDPKYASKYPPAVSYDAPRGSTGANAGRRWGGPGQSEGNTEVTTGPAESQVFFEDRGNAMVVDAYVNNRPVKMIFDTGAEAVVFGKNHLSELGLGMPKGEATGLSFGVGDGGAQRAWNTTATIKLGQIEKTNCPIAVHEDMPTLPLLGQTFFKDFQYSIQRGQNGGGSIRFRRKNAYSGDSMARDPGAVPFVRQGNEIVVPVEINGRKTNMFFDTGAEQCVFSETQLRQLGITVPEDAVDGRSIGIAGSTATKTFTVARMRLGSVEKTNVPISMVESYHMPLPLLGQTFFGDLRCELDNEAHLLRLRR